jgi:uncharacterized membrane protein
VAVDSVVVDSVVVDSAVAAGAAAGAVPAAAVLQENGDMQLTRLIKHLVAPPWLAHRAFSNTALQTIEDAVTAAEKHHCGELRFVAEAGLPLGDLLHSISARQRAVEIFSRLRIWDTEQNCGVLIYVQLIDRRVEIVADRGISARVAQNEWDAVSRNMEAAFREGAYESGAVAAIERIGSLLAAHFPVTMASAENPNELPDRPMLL